MFSPSAGGGGNPIVFSIGFIVPFHCSRTKLAALYSDVVIIYELVDQLIKIIN